MINAQVRDGLRDHPLGIGNSSYLPSNGLGVVLDFGNTNLFSYQGRLVTGGNREIYHYRSMQFNSQVLSYEQFKEMYYYSRYVMDVMIPDMKIAVGKGLVADPTFGFSPLIMVACRTWPSETEDMILLIQKQYTHPYITRLATEMASEFPGHVLTCTEISQYLTPGIVIPAMASPTDRIKFEKEWFDLLLEKELATTPEPDLKETMVIVDDLEQSAGEVLPFTQSGNIVVSDGSNTWTIPPGLSATTVGDVTVNTTSTTLNYREFIAANQMEEQRREEMLRELMGEEMPNDDEIEEESRPVINPELPLSEQLRLAEELMRNS